MSKRLILLIILLSIAFIAMATLIFFTSDYYKNTQKQMVNEKGPVTIKNDITKQIVNEKDTITIKKDTTSVRSCPVRSDESIAIEKGYCKKTIIDIVNSRVDESSRPPQQWRASLLFVNDYMYIFTVQNIDEDALFQYVVKDTSFGKLGMFWITPMNKKGAEWLNLNQGEFDSHLNEIDPDLTKKYLSVRGFEFTY